MAATATISTSKTHPVVGRSTMNLVGAAGPLCSPPPSPELASSASHGSLPAGHTTSKPLLNASSSSSKAVSTAVTPNSATATTAAASATLSPVAAVAPAALFSVRPSASVQVSSVKASLPAATPSVSKTISTAPTATSTKATTTATTGAGHPRATTTTATTTATTKPIVSKSALAPVVAPATSRSGEATTFFDDMINAPQPPANILTLSPTTLLPDLYHDFFDNHPELYDSDQSSDPEMDLDMEDCSPAVIRARAMEDIRQTNAASIAAPLIADRPKLETIDTINLVLHRQNLPVQNQNNYGGQVSSDDCSSGQAQSRKKKASRACSHCQKAHLTCDDSRPCQRCVKRDLAGSCTDGIRKKAKYLQGTIEAQQRAAEQARLDQEALEQSKRASSEESPLSDAQALYNFPNVSSSTSPSSLSAIITTSLPLKSTITLPLSPISLSSSTSTSPRLTPDHGFESEAVNLEYSILSTMLSSPTSELSSMASELSMVENWQRQGAIEAMANSLQHSHHHHPHHLSGQLKSSLSHNNNHNHNSHSNSNSNQASADNSSSNAVANTNSGSASGGRVSKRKFPSNTPENVYANTKQPFNYTDGFHYLLRYVRERMDKEEMMRVCRAMAMFRPSFIALIMNLTPEDLIFMETCFQRTVLEFEKLISFSGTPTVVWRRTGEIALVGKEFSLLTQWSREQLLNKKTYIYELMDNQSAVEYWEKFSTHAFENTEQTVMTTCILLSPTNRIVPCTFCFTIKRDIFDIPLAIVGNFLPILS